MIHFHHYPCRKSDIERQCETDQKIRRTIYCREQRDLLRALEDLAASERVMHELDNRKDQIMTVCKVALTNLAMWVVSFNGSAK